MLDGKGGGGIEHMSGHGVIVIAELHQMFENGGKLGIVGFAEEVKKAAPGLTGLKGALLGIGFFGKLSDVVEGELANPALEKISRNIKGGSVSNIEFGSLLDGVHQGQFTAGQGVDDANWIHRILVSWFGGTVKPQRHEERKGENFNHG
jgi:hypothetical protein